MQKHNQRAAARFQETISRLVSKPVHLTITDNTYSMIHIRSTNSGYTVRLHHMFLEADIKVLSSLARFIKSRNRKPPSTLRDFVASNSNKIRKAPRRPQRTALRHLGRYFNLKEVFDQVNVEYFGNKLDCHITWGAKRRVRQQNSIRLGSYSEATKTIRVNPVLDRSYVPQYVVMGIIHHEMLHHYLGVESCNGRKISHSKTFHQLEVQYRHHHRLQAWKKKHLHRLLGR